jgi:NAD(P)-dependent dehydrogenase (short-subunit alcohol dehydrogenase family)
MSNVLITSAASGIGRLIVEALLSSGDKVAAFDVTGLQE